MAPREPHLRAVLLDVGGTIWPDPWPEPEKVREEQLLRLAEFLGLPAEVASRLHEALEVADGESRARADRVHHWRAVVRDALTSAELGVDDDSVERARSAMAIPAEGRVELLPGVIELVELLSANGIAAALVTNTSWRIAADYDRDLRAFGVPKHLAGWLTSAEAGARKPSLSIFRLVLDLLGLHPEECLMIGDSEEDDIIPARELGMRAIRLVSGPLDETATNADAAAQSIYEATGLIEAWVGDRRKARNPEGR